MDTPRIPALWWGWLVAAFVLTALTAIGYILYPHAALQTASSALLGSEHALGSASDAVLRFIKWMSGVSAAVSLAWMVTLVLIVVGPFRRGELWAWQAITASVVLWFLVDSARSIEIGFSQNAMLNLVWLLMYVVPLIATYRRFHHNRGTMLREHDAALRPPS